MEKQTSRIRAFSKGIHIVLKILFVVFIVVGAIELIGWLAFSSGLPTELVEIDGGFVEAPLLFKLGNFTVVLPFFEFFRPGGAGYDFPLRTELLQTFDIEEVLRTIFTVVVLGFAKRVFRVLRESGTPFNADVVKGLKKFAVALVCVGVVTGIIGFLAAGVVWVMCLIFDYGLALQNESDTTL